MSKTKWMLAVVPLLLAAAPAALADDAGDAHGQVAVLVPASADEVRSQDADARRVQELEAEVKELQSELAARSSDGPQYLDQNDPLSP
jgi:hypothetical protein